MEIRVKRVSEPVERTDGIRVLVDRYWPRGVRRDQIAVDLWAREVAPSPELIAWYSHRSERWEGFKTRYRQELSAGERHMMADRLRATSRGATLTLVFGSRDRQHNPAVALAELLDDGQDDICAEPIPRSEEWVEETRERAAKPYRDVEALNWVWTLFALAIPVILLIWGETVLLIGRPALVASVLIFVLLVAVSTIRAVRRDREMLASQLGGSTLIREDAQHVLVGVGSLVGQLAGVVLGLLILGLLPEAIAHTINRL